MLRSKFSSLREYLTPISHASNFSTTGEINPEEFVLAGDYLVSKFPTWQWSTCPKEFQKSFLPPEKQYLITKHVPSYQRASNYLSGGNVNFDEEDEEYEDEEGDGWVKSRKLVTDSSNSNSEQTEQKVPEISDIDDLIDENAEEEDEGEDEDFDDVDIIKNSDGNLRRVPKMYIVGYNSNGIPLNPEQMFEDINSDYRDKTATIENLPVAHNTTSVSIHPCKHSSVMKVLMKHSELKKKQKQEDVEELSKALKETSITGEHKTDINNEEEPTTRVDQYLVVFLKFISSVTPGIEYDYTTQTYL